MNDCTRQFNLNQNTPNEMEEVLKSVYAALVEKGYKSIRLSAIFFLKIRLISQRTTMRAALSAGLTAMSFCKSLSEAISGINN